MDMKTIQVNNGLSLVEESLREQCRDGTAVVNGNRGCGNDNLWGYLYMIVPHDKDLAEQVRRSFLNKSPQEALALVEEIHRDHFHKAMRGISP